MNCEYRRSKGESYCRLPIPDFGLRTSHFELTSVPSSPVSRRMRVKRGEDREWAWMPATFFQMPHLDTSNKKHEKKVLAKQSHLTATLYITNYRFPPPRPPARMDRPLARLDKTTKHGRWRDCGRIHEMWVNLRALPWADIQRRLRRLSSIDIGTDRCMGLLSSPSSWTTPISANAADSLNWPTLMVRSPSSTREGGS